MIEEAFKVATIIAVKYAPLKMMFMMKRSRRSICIHTTNFIHNVFLICVIKHKLFWFRAYFSRAIKLNMASVQDLMTLHVYHILNMYLCSTSGIACFTSSFLRTSLKRERWSFNMCVCVCVFLELFVFFLFKVTD